MKKPKSENTILLTFADKETVNYVKLVCRRKGTNLEAYIVDNFEWDDKPFCLFYGVEKITEETCKGCEYVDTCPDAVKEKQIVQAKIVTKGCE